MCYHSKLSKSIPELKSRFDSNWKQPILFEPSIYNGFQNPKTPVITHREPNEIQLYQWGLIPFWARDDKIKKHTLNARIETIKEKPSYRNVVDNRCLILADGFYEWQWLDAKGKRKQKYELSIPGDEAFAFAGLWSEWLDKSTGELVSSYTILTTEANQLMSKIHNNKKRMPIIVSIDNEQKWLHGDALKMQNDRLIATPL